MNKDYNIGVFDSGLGGITVLREISKLLPNENIIYFGDTKNVPYGEKTQEEIQILCERIVRFLFTNGCKLIVIACNTASIAAYEYLHKISPIPIVGIINSAIDSIPNNTYKEIGIIGTPFTINSGEYPKKIKERDENLKTYSVGCEKLCPMIEKGWENFSDRRVILADYITRIPKSAEALLLACTHYPLILNDIKDIFEGDILDPGEECAREVFRTLKNHNLLNSKNEKGKIEFYVSGDKDIFQKKAQEFLGYEINKIFKVNI
ncbi:MULTISPECIES: glutamate racemase [Fusobacterium]|uniref:glutamate racemase n=1 Tax=Fusobacterium TaxID=848 RepID=UPI0014773528|nr:MULTISPECIES: glutamate racemase [Fusobacterium]NME35847.1 glutamate racemase [Fusobacterium sp. FSA-380-WT-3A]